MVGFLFTLVSWVFFQSRTEKSVKDRYVTRLRIVLSASAAASAVTARRVAARARQQNERRGPKNVVEPRNVDAILDGALLRGFGLASPLLGEGRVRRVRGRVDVAVAEVATAYADLEAEEGGGGIYFSSSR